MAAGKFKTMLSRFMADYGMVVALLVLCAVFSWLTWDEQYPTGADAGERLAEKIVEDHGKSVRVLIAARDSEQDVAFADALRDELTEAGVTVVATIKGEPADAKAAMKKDVAAGGRIDVIAANDFTARKWGVFEDLGEELPALAETRIVTPPPYWWPNFLMGDNLLNVADQIVVIAILAIGMTMVIVTAGIDLSVGSLVALSAVTAAWLIRDFAGAENASATGMILCCLAGIAVCAAMGLFTGTMVTLFDMPPFVVTLGMMWIARGAAYILADGQSISDLPESFKWLGRSKDLVGIPNLVILMVILYAAAHIMMSRMKLGRYIYAVGGNREAARLSGVPVRRVLLFVYVACGALAGLGGIVMASQLKSGDPTCGKMYELYTIAAVVVGGTSLAGGEGKILGTLIGAFIIAVIANGMNLIGVKDYPQYVVFGLLILAAVLLDMLKKRGWSMLKRLRT